MPSLCVHLVLAYYAFWFGVLIASRIYLLGLVRPWLVWICSVHAKCDTPMKLDKVRHNGSQDRIRSIRLLLARLINCSKCLVHIARPALSARREAGHYHPICDRKRAFSDCDSASCALTSASSFCVSASRSAFSSSSSLVPTATPIKPISTSAQIIPGRTTHLPPISQGATDAG